MNKRLFLALLLLLAYAPASALSGRGAFVFTQAIRAAGLQPIACPGKLGGKDDRCATGPARKAVTQAKLSHYKGWKQTDAWKGDTAGFTSTGKDSFVVTVINKIGSNKVGSRGSSLLIFSEF